MEITQIYEVYRLGNYIGFTFTLKDAYEYIKSEWENYDGRGSRYENGLRQLEKEYKKCLETGANEFKCFEYEVAAFGPLV